MALHYLGIHGKKGRVRKKLGTIVNEPSDPGTVTMKFSIAAPQLTFHADGTVEMKANAAVPKGFRHDRFRRALHYVATNVVAAMEGAPSVLEAKYDAVRNYIRKPRNRQEAWAYAELNPPMKDIPRVLNGAIVVDAPHGKIVELQLFQTTYWVDLLNSGDLTTGENQPGVKIIEADITTLPPVVIHWKVQPKPPPAALYIDSSLNCDQVEVGDSPRCLGSARPSVSQGVAHRRSSRARTVDRGREPASSKVGSRRARPSREAS
jgi:hypothetical protein